MILFKKRKNTKAPAKNDSRNTSQDWLPIRDVYNSMIHRKDGHMIAAVFIHPVNIHLLSENEKARLIQSLEEVLNGIDISFQILSIARPVDLDAYIAKLNSMRTETSSTIKQRLIGGYINVAAQMATSGEALERQFYILIDQKPSQNSQIDQSSLLSKANEIASNLTSAGLTAEVCNDEQIRDLLFIFTNPNQAAYERAPISSIQLPSIYYK